MDLIDEDKLNLAATLTKDACFSRIQIDYKLDKKTIKKYEHFYCNIFVILYYILTIINLSTILIEHPSTFLVQGKEPPFLIAIVINTICELYFYYRWYLIYSVSVKNAFRKSLSMKLTITILVLMTVDTIIYTTFRLMNFEGMIRFSRILRPILLLTFPENRKLRNAFKNLAYTVGNVIPVFGLLISVIAIISLITSLLLDHQNLKYPDGDSYFDNFLDIFWELYVLTTTANSPDVIVPAYEHNRAYILIYVIVSALCNWVFTGILTASVYNSYKAHLGEFVIESVEKRKTKLDQAFHILASPMHDGQLGINDHIFVKLMKSVFVKTDEDYLYVLFRVLDKNQSRYLNQTEFSQLTECTAIQMQEIPLTRDYFKQFLPFLYDIYMSKPFQQFKFITQHNITKQFFLAVTVSNAITAAMFLSNPELETIFSWLYTIIFLIELIINYLASGGVRFFNNGWYIFDMFIVFGGLLGEILHSALASVGVYVPRGITQMIFLLRLFRLLKVMRNVPSFRAVIHCVLVTLPSLVAYAALLAMFYYIFTCFAMDVYGLKYVEPVDYNYTASSNCSNPWMNGTEYVSWHYCTFNFNSASHAFLLLLILSVGNNWHVFTEGHVIITNKWSRLFFFTVHTTCVILVLNVVLAFIIEAFLIGYTGEEAEFETYFRDRLSEMGLNAKEKLPNMGITDFWKSDFIITKELLNEVSSQSALTSKLYVMKSGDISVDILLYRMFEKEIDQVLQARRQSKSRLMFQVHDVYA